MNIDDLFVSDIANELERLELDGVTMKAGSRTISLDGHWIDILSVESDEFKNTELRLYRLAASKPEAETKAESLVRADEINHGLTAALIGGWSFDTPCTAENKIKAVKNWPRSLVKLIDKTASERVKFTVGKQKS